MFFYKAQCGHWTRLRGAVRAFGEKVVTTMPREDGHPKYCLKCLAKMAIRCGLCGRAIFVGDPVAVYYGHARRVNILPESSDSNLEKKRDEKKVIGCLRTDCAHSGSDRAGFWHPDIKILRAMSPFEMILRGMTEENRQDSPCHDAASIRDLSNPAEAIPIL
jgi:hypothetical protein